MALTHLELAIADDIWLSNSYHWLDMDDATTIAKHLINNVLTQPSTIRALIQEAESRGRAVT